MEPRLLRRGNDSSATMALNSPALLQWSHAFSDVETGLKGIEGRSEVRLQWSHAFSDVETIPAAEISEF